MPYEEILAKNGYYWWRKDKDSEWKLVEVRGNLIRSFPFPGWLKLTNFPGEFVKIEEPKEE